MCFELISNKRPRHVSAKKEAVDKGDAHSRHFPSARKAFIKSFDIFLYFFFFFPFCTWDTPLAARLAWSLSDLGPPLARYKDIIRHAVLGQKSKKEKKKRCSNDRILMRRSLASSSSKAARTVKETDAIKTPPVTRKQVGTEGKKIMRCDFLCDFFLFFLDFNFEIHFVRVCSCRVQPREGLR